MSSEEVSKRFGDGIEAYFNYCRVLLITNSVTMLLQVMVYIVYASKESPQYNQRRWYNEFFITSFKPGNEYDLWMAVNITCVVVSALTLPAVLYRKKKKEEASELIRHPALSSAVQRDDSEVTDMIVRYCDDGTIDVSSHFRTAGYRAIRIFFSVFFFCALLTVQVVVSYYITKAEDTSSDPAVAFVIALVVAGLNLIYGLVADLLTEMEKPNTMRVFKISNTFKLLLFKLCNVITVYAAKNFSHVKECAYDVIGQQFLYILLVDMTVMNVFELFLPFLTSKVRRWMAIRDRNDLQSDQDLLPPFDVSCEYLDTIYRQYLVYMAMTVFPLAAALSWVGQALEYWVDRLKLFKLAGKPKNMDYSVRSQGFMIMMFQLIVLIAALFTPYAGVVWVLSKETATATALKCQFP
jgi:hypothetical protein